MQIDWNATWIVTLVGFTLVVILLILLTYVLKLFGYIMSRMGSGRKAAPQAAVPSSDATAEEAAAIALALQLAAEPAHDEESGKLTFRRGAQSAWAPKTYGMNNLTK